MRAFVELLGDLATILILAQQNLSRFYFLDFRSRFFANEILVLFYVGRPSRAQAGAKNPLRNLDSRRVPYVSRPARMAGRYPAARIRMLGSGVSTVTVPPRGRAVAGP